MYIPVYSLGTGRKLHMYYKTLRRPPGVFKKVLCAFSYVLSPEYLSPRQIYIMNLLCDNIFAKTLLCRCLTVSLTCLDHYMCLEMLVTKAGTGVHLWRKVSLTISQNSHDSLLFNGVAGPHSSIFTKKRLQQSHFFCEFCKIFKSTLFTERLRKTKSVAMRKR